MTLGSVVREHFSKMLTVFAEPFLFFVLFLVNSVAYWIWAAAAVAMQVGP